MNELPSFEKKRIPDQELVEALRAGVDEPETRRLLEDWTRQEEEKITEPADAIGFNRKRGKLYVEAGYVAEGIETLEGALDQAFHERREDIIREIQAEIDNVIGR